MMDYLTAIRSFGRLELTSLYAAFAVVGQEEGRTLEEIEANGDISGVTDFIFTWGGCTSLTSFPLLDVSAGTDFFGAWIACDSLTTFPAGMFDTCLATDFSGAFMFCPLTSASVDNILVSLDTAGQSDGQLDMGGSCEEPGPAGAAALLSLEGKGWTVTFEEIPF